jgi:predicted permease
MGMILQDIRYSLRQLRLAPAFTATVVLTLALGIGATTAIFTLVHAVMLRSLPVVDPSRLYRLGDNQECCVNGGPRSDGRWSLFSYELFTRLKAATPEFEELAAFQANPNKYGFRRGTSGTPAKPLNGEFVTGNYFSMFGIGSFAGRVFNPADDTPSASPVVVLSYRAWQQEFAADRSILNSTVYIQGHPFTVIGIAPPGFFGDTVSDSPPAFWMPLQQEPMLLGNSALLHEKIPNWLRAIGRLKPGATIEGMAARVTTVLGNWIPDSGIDALVPANERTEYEKMLKLQHIGIIPAGGGVGVMEENYGSSLKVLLLICASVLLIACANIANLLLARSTVRRHQTSLQMALGASRPRLIRQALTESVVLAALGGIAGIAFAYIGTRAILTMTFGDATFLPISPTPSLPVLAFALALAIVTGILFGTAPAWIATHANPVEALRGANRSTRDKSSLPQKALVIIQVMLSVVLLTGAGMLVHSLRNLEHRDFGFDTTNRIMVDVNSPPASYTPEHLQSLYTQLHDRIAQIPGVERVALATYTPFTDNWGEGIVVEGKDNKLLTDDVGTSWDRVAPGYFEAVGQSIVRGRGIEQQDTSTSVHVAVINEAFANHYFKGENPIGHHFGMDVQAYAHSYEIVGVVHDSYYHSIQEPPNPMFFVPLTQTQIFKEPIMQSGETRSHFISSAAVVFHGTPEQLEPQIRKAFAEVDADLPIIGLHRLDDRIAGNFDQQRTVARLAGLFSALALILAAVGLYGVTAYSVARRTNEIGVRMALGANRMRVVRMVLRGALTQMGIGMLIGIPAAIGCAKLLSAQLFQVGPWDPTPLIVAVALLIVCAIAAAIIPARRAASLDPMKALRIE